MTPKESKLPKMYRDWPQKLYEEFWAKCFNKKFKEYQDKENEKIRKPNK